VPHTEVDCILADGQSVEFSFQPQQTTVIEVYPSIAEVKTARIKKLKPRLSRQLKFVVDVHLGKLARYLRILGIDTAYKNDFTKDDIIKISCQEKRVILTRSVSLLKSKVVKRGYFVRANVPSRQINEIIKEFGLISKIKPLSRCLECNGMIKTIAKSKIIDQLPVLTKVYYNRFYICSSCGKIYWKGTHFKGLAKFVFRLSGHLLAE
jgi:uncharacterized protein with PIN domain